MGRSKRAVRKAKGDARYSDNRTNVPPTVDTFLWQLQRLNIMGFVHVKTMVELAARPEFAEYQLDVLEAALTKLFKVGKPRPVQLRVVRRIVYGVGDTLLIARTGFGKSLTFQAFCALTGRIALQLIPLSKLGDQQAGRMTRIKGASACLITAETLERDSGLMIDVRKGKYNHILLGPEQAVSPRFKSILRHPDFAKLVGLVIIDECHVLSSWGTFRSSVTHINELRHTLPSRVPMYGCTATLTAEQERDVKTNGGFRSEDERLSGLQVIRISVDRPEIQLVVCPIMHGRAMSYAQLYFVLNGVVHDVDSPGWFERGRVLPHSIATVEDCVASPRILRTPRRIPKTIIFIDGAKRIENAAGYIRLWLRALGFTAEEAVQIVCTYSSHTSRHDQDIIIAEFEKEDSQIRILVATSAVGMGMDIVDVDVVVQWDLPLDQEVSDLWQRWGRVARGPDRCGLAVLFAPYYCFDRLGRVALMNPLLANASRSAAVAQQCSQQSSQQSVHAPSRLRESQTVSSGAGGDDSPGETDYGSTADESDVAPSQPSSSQLQASGGRRPASKAPGPWTKTEIARRGWVSPMFLNLCNAACIRFLILRALQDHMCETDSQQAAAVGVKCCSGSECGPELARAAEQWAVAPDSKVSILKRPKAKSKSGRVFISLEKWVQLRAAEYSDGAGLMCAAPIAVIMSTRARISIAVALGKSRTSRDGSGLPEALCIAGAFQALDAVKSWIKELRSMAEWHTEAYVDELVERLCIDAAKWPVFDWKNPNIEDVSDVVFRLDVALREADLTAARREQKEKEDQVRTAMAELQARGVSADITARLSRLTTDMQSSRNRAENIEFVLAATQNIQHRMTGGFGSQTAASTPLGIISGSSSTLLTSSFTSVATSESVDAGEGVDSSASGAAGARVSSGDNDQLARVSEVAETATMVTSAGAHSASVLSGVVAATPVQRSHPGRPHTPVGNASGKRVACTPGSGRRGGKRKVPRGMAATGIDRGADDRCSDGDDDYVAGAPSPIGSVGSVGGRVSGRVRTPTGRHTESQAGWR